MCKHLRHMAPQRCTQRAVCIGDPAEFGMYPRQRAVRGPGGCVVGPAIGQDGCLVQRHEARAVGRELDPRGIADDGAVHPRIARCLVGHYHVQQAAAVVGIRIDRVHDVMCADGIGHGGKPGHQAIVVAREQVAAAVAREPYLRMEDLQVRFEVAAGRL